MLAPTVLALAIALLSPQSTVNGGADNEISETPHRIITIAPNSAEIICALGACDLIVGVSKFCVYPPELQGRPKVGGLFDPDLEKIVMLRPTLVVLRGNSESVEQLCRQRAIALYQDQTERLGDIESCVWELGARLDRPDKAKQVVKRFRDELDAIRKRVANRPRPRVFVTIARQPDRLANLLTAGKGNFLDEMLDIASGDNVFGNVEMAYPQVSAESIIAHRPEVIIEFMPEVTMTPALEAALLDQWRKVGTVPAVAADRVYFVTDDNSLIPSLRYVEIIDKVSRLLHPEPTRDR
ncbi:MAG: helical backbone metal receptor [Phycisphaerae bacterium]|jgi:iron complex transport system substrate-binding protein